MNDITKWVSFILALNALMSLGGFCAADNATLVEDDNDSVVVEARSLPRTSGRQSRQLQHLTPLSWFQAFGEGSSCITSTGSIGACTSVRNCNPIQQYYLRQNWQSPNAWLPQGQETCNFFDDYGQQSAGVCCLDDFEAPVPEKEQSAEESGELPTGTSAYENDYDQQKPVDNNVNYDTTNEASQESQEVAESGEQYQFNWPPQAVYPPGAVYPSGAGAQWPPPLPTHAPGTISQWPPQVPTHPPDHHYPTHPPNPNLTTRPPTAVTSARPTYPTYRPTQRPTYPTYPTTPRPTTKPPSPTQPVSTAVGRCGAKNGVSPDQERIVGGQNSSPNEWPWIVVLFNKGKQFCGGSLIDNLHILTAAHCVARMNSWDVAGLTAHLGDHNIRTTFEVMHVERKIKRLVRHKGFDFSTLHNDVAVLTMDRPVTFTREVRPICLPHASARKTYSGQIATVAGWGSLRENGPQPSILQKVSIPIWSNPECARKYGRAAPGGIIDSMVCAGQAARDSCSGDSGGPLMLNDGGHWTQIGIVSWGIGCGKGQYPGVYTRTTAFLPWILKNIK